MMENISSESSSLDATPEHQSQKSKIQPEHILREKGNVCCCCYCCEDDDDDAHAPTNSKTTFSCIVYF
jgi:hypothetical protein